MRFPLLLLALLGAIFFAPTAANAACTASTENGQTFPDAFGDDEGGLAPDISAVSFVTTAKCAIGGGVSLSDRRTDLINGESVGIYMNLDANQATGSQGGFKGADRVVIQSGATGTDPDPGLGVWNAATNQFDFGDVDALDVGAGDFATTIDRLGVQPGTMSIETITMYRGIYDNYADFAPGLGSAAFRYSVAFTSGAAPAPTPSAPATAAPAYPAPSTPPAKSTQTDDIAPTRTCRPPRVRGLTLAGARSRLRSAGCKVSVRYRRSGSVRSGRVISAVQDGQTVIVTVARRARARAASPAGLAQLERAFQDAAGRR